MLGPKVFGRLMAGLFVVATVSLFTAASSSAQTYVGVPPPTVGTTDTAAPIVLGVQFRPGQLASGQLPQVASSVQVRAQASRLAVTGGDLLALLVMATGAVTVGLVLVRSGRRKRIADAPSV